MTGISLSLAPKTLHVYPLSDTVFFVNFVFTLQELIRQRKMLLKIIIRPKEILYGAIQIWCHPLGVQDRNICKKLDQQNGNKVFQN